MIQTVLFDYISTLGGLPSSQVVAQACYDAALPLYRELAILHDRDAAIVAPLIEQAITEQGRLAHQSDPLREGDATQLHRVALASLGLSATDDWIRRLMDRVHAAIFEVLILAPEAVSVLSRLHAEHYRIGLISNDIYPRRQAILSLERFGLLPYFDTCIFSSDIGWRKPSPIIFEQILSVLGADPATTLMVGDSLQCDIAGAQAVGCRAIQTLQFQVSATSTVRPQATIQRLADLTPLLCGSGKAWL